jgi:hypothetical protein
MATMDITDFQNKRVEIDHYQATYLVLKVENQLFRVDFSAKKAFHLKKGTFETFYYFENHPLLMDYNESWLATYINSKPEQVEDFITDFKNMIDEMTEGWRQWTHYVVDKKTRFTEDTFVDNVKHGRGKLFNAPFTITQKVLAVCAKHHVATKTFGNEFKSDAFKLILIGDNYVIAKAFRIQTLIK